MAPLKFTILVVFFYLPLLTLISGSGDLGNQSPQALSPNPKSPSNPIIKMPSLSNGSNEEPQQSSVSIPKENESRNSVDNEPASVPNRSIQKKIPPKSNDQKSLENENNSGQPSLPPKSSQVSKEPPKTSGLSNEQPNHGEVSVPDVQDLDNELPLKNLPIQSEPSENHVIPKKSSKKPQSPQKHQPSVSIDDNVDQITSNEKDDTSESIPEISSDSFVSKSHITSKPSKQVPKSTLTYDNSRSQENPTDTATSNETLSSSSPTSSVTTNTTTDSNTSPTKTRSESENSTSISSTSSTHSSSGVPSGSAKRSGSWGGVLGLVVLGIVCASNNMNF
ncbi:hypothetical protein G9A89_002234 [Geosiphon pyriformis]|nr:hypothetical protein G9A89_002234 [Geosiphon pyriformis]